MGRGLSRVAAEGAEPRLLSVAGTIIGDLGAGVVEDRKGVTMEEKLSSAGRGAGGSLGAGAEGNRLDPDRGLTTIIGDAMAGDGD